MPWYYIQHVALYFDLQMVLQFYPCHHEHYLASRVIYHLPYLSESTNDYDMTVYILMIECHDG